MAVFVMVVSVVEVTGVTLYYQCGVLWCGESVTGIVYAVSNSNGVLIVVILCHDIGSGALMNLW